MLIIFKQSRRQIAKVNKMGVIQKFFNNREIAIGVWVIIGLAVILPTKPARQFIKTAIPILFCKKFVIFYIVFISFLGLVLCTLNWAGFWDLTLLKDTVFWVLFVELPLFTKAIEKAESGRFFSKLIRENVAIAVAIEFFVGFWTFSLITEIILIPLTVLISVLYVLAGQNKKHRSVKRFFDGLLVLWGMILLINAIYSLIHAPNHFFSFDTLKSLLLPLVLLVFNLPVVYGLALYNTYEQIFIRIKGSKSEQMKMKWQVIRFSGINLSKVSAIRKSLPNTMVCCRTSKDLQISLDKLARRLNLQIGENYMKRSRYYVSVCIAGLILSLIGLIGANSDVSLKDIVTLNLVFDIPRIKEILTYIFSTMIVFSATLLFFTIGFAKKQREDISQIKKYALYELLLSVKIQHSQLIDYPPVDEPTDLFCAYVLNVYEVRIACDKVLAAYENLLTTWEQETVKNLQLSALVLSNNFGITAENVGKYTATQFCNFYNDQVRTAPQNEKINTFTHTIKADIEKYSKHIEQFCVDFKHYY